MQHSFDATRARPRSRLAVTPRGGIAALAAATLLAFAGTAEAGTATNNLTVSVTITASCTVAASTLDFGSLAGTALTAVAQATTTVNVTCTNGSPYAIGMGQGAHYSTTNNMISGVNTLGYTLYTDSGYSHPWTTAASNSTCTTANSCITGTGSGVAIASTIYGQIPIQATLPASGSYADTVVMTVTF